MFIIFTEASGKKIRLSADSILYYKEIDTVLITNGSYIRTALDSFTVKETVEQIDRVLSESYIFVKKVENKNED